MKTIVSSLLLSTTLLLQAGEIISAGDLQVRQVKPEAVTQVPLGSYLVGYMNPPASRYTVSSNTDGFVTTIHIEKYASVQKGDPLFTLKSPSLLELQSRYISLLIDMDFYQKEQKRLKPLTETGVVAAKRYLEVSNKMMQINASARSIQDVMLSYGMEPKRVDQVTKSRKAYPYITLYAPAAMQVQDIDVVNGDFLPQGKQLATLVDPSRCHIEVDLPWQTVTTISPGDLLYADTTRLTVDAIAPTIDSRSQTKSLHLDMKEDCEGRGGASVNAMLYRQKNAWKVPGDAVITFKGKPVVFRAEGSGYQPIDVILLARDADAVYVDGALDKAQPIAASSLIALKSAAEAQQE